jgi:hypothetical protein
MTTTMSNSPWMRALNGAKPIAENRHANLLLYAQTLYKRLKKSTLVKL